ncbi:hypothetical protein QZH41_011956 [Actinostola sp. cb2023]|nr:hypothetical protein QZH41_011956 [Actinostola sp. cb2023]
MVVYMLGHILSGCLHRSTFYEVGEIFTDKWCSEYCTCKEQGVTTCRPICPMEWIECGQGLRAKKIYEPVMDGMCSCPRHVCVMDV